MSIKLALGAAFKILAQGVAIAALCSSAQAGSIFLTGHDPDFHASLGGNLAGARKINTTAISYVMDSNFNSFVATAPKFLFVESNIPVPGGHTVGKQGIIDSGYVEGVDFVHVDASGLTAALGQLGQANGYSAIVIASDFGGILTQAELDILNANSASIINFLNAGGGLYAMAESDLGAGLTPNGGHYGFLPFVVSTTAANQSESGFTVTGYGASLGLTNADVNGNASHNFFNSTAGMNIVDLDANGRIMSLATRSQINTGGVIPEPASTALVGLALLGLAATRRRRA